jgi:hypothetical protein
MVEQSIACPSCGHTIPLTRALRADIERAVKRDFEQQLRAEVEQARAAAAREAEQRSAAELAGLQDELRVQALALEQARALELAMRRRERELERLQQEVELTIERRLDEERRRVAEEAAARLAEQHRLKDAEKERQLADMRRQIEDLKRRAEQGSQQLQGEAGEAELEADLRAAFPWDEIAPVPQGVRGADLHQTVADARGGAAGTLLWECKNTRHWSDGWIAKLKEDQRALRADVAILVTSAMPKGCVRLATIDGVLVCDFASAVALAAVVRSHLLQLSQARSAAVHKTEALELLFRYLSGPEFRHRVEGVVDAFARMREDLDQERRAAERQWARRAKQIEAVTLNVSGMYGDLQGLLPSLPAIPQLSLPECEEADLFR